MSEKIDQLEGRLSEKGSLLAVYRSFTEHPAWAMYTRLLEDQMNTRKGEILLKPLKSTEQVYEQEYMKGEISGLTLAQVSIFAIMEGLDQEVKATRVQLEREHEAENRISADGGSRVDSKQWHGGSDELDTSGG